MNKKIFLIMGLFVLLAMKCTSSNIITNGSYSPIVFYLGYIFISFDFMNRINKMSLYRYHSLKNIYIYVCKKQTTLIVSYTFLFMVIGVCTEIIGLFGDPIYVSLYARIKFFAISFINLFILNYFQVVIRVLYGKWIALVIICSCIFFSVGKSLIGFDYITPFVFDTAYMRAKTVLNYHTLINYILFIIIIIFFTILSVKKDKMI